MTVRYVIGDSRKVVASLPPASVNAELARERLGMMLTEVTRAEAVA